MFASLGVFVSQVGTPTTTPITTTTTVPKGPLGLPGAVTDAAQNIPGSNVLLTVVKGLSGWGIILELGALVIAAIIWAWASFTSNQGQISQGRRGVLVAAAATVIIAAGPTLVGWAWGLGQQVKAN